MSKVFDIPQELIERVHNVWLAIRSLYPLDALKFKDYCAMVADQFETLYPDYEICPSLHRILRHGYMLVEACPDTLSLGHYSEEGLESSNKYVKSFAITRSRQMSRRMRLNDTFQRLLDGSDPILLSKRMKRIKKKMEKRKYPDEVLNLFKFQL